MTYSDSTRRGYASDWRGFTSWCAERGVCPLPANPIDCLAYLTELSSRCTRATVQRHRTTICRMHESAGFDTPTTTLAIRTLLRSWGAPSVGKDALTVETLARAIRATPIDLIGTRDRAILAACFAGAFRRSQLVALNVGDKVALHPAPGTPDAGALIASWLDAAGITEGPVFRGVNRHGHVSDRRLSGRAVNDVVKRRLSAIDVDVENLSSSSLRWGRTSTWVAEHGSYVALDLASLRGMGTIDRHSGKKAA